MKKTWILTLSALIIPAVLYADWGNSCWSDYSSMGRGHWFSGNFFGGGPIMFITILLAFGILGFFAFSLFKNRKFVGLDSADPFEILKRRYAKGDISKDEYYKINSELKGS